MKGSIKKGLKKTWNNRDSFWKLLGIASSVIFFFIEIIFKLDSDARWWLAIFLVLSSIFLFLVRTIKLPEAEPIIQDLISSKTGKRAEAILNLKKIAAAQRSELTIRAIIRSSEVRWQHEILKELVPISSLYNLKYLKYFLKNLIEKADGRSIDDDTLKMIFEFTNEQNKVKLETGINRILQSSRKDDITKGALLVTPFWSNDSSLFVIRILENEEMRIDIREVSVITLGKMKCVSAIPVFQKLYDGSKDALRRRMLAATEEIGQGEQLFFQYAALYKKSGDTVRGEAMRLLVAYRSDLDEARKHLCSICTDSEERPIIRSQAAHYLKELNDDAELELLSFCEDEKVQITLRIEGVRALKREGLKDSDVVKKRLKNLQEQMIIKSSELPKNEKKPFEQFNEVLQDTLHFLFKL